MRKVDTSEIIDKVRGMCIEANYRLGEDVLGALKRAKDAEDSPLGGQIIEEIINNAAIAEGERVPTCQDTGFAVLFLDVGQDLRIEGGDLYQAVNEGVRRGYKEGYLRASIVKDPLSRVNTGDNTPAVIHTRIVPGDRLKITFAAKGAGSENMSGVAMLTPSAGLEGVMEFVVNTVKRAGGNPCPPIVVGVGIGGTMEMAAIIAKRAALREIGTPNPDPEMARVEGELLGRINDLGIGPQGLGGRTTALAVHVEIYPCHIASLPVAVNINCHAYRHQEVVL